MDPCAKDPSMDHCATPAITISTESFCYLQLLFATYFLSNYRSYTEVATRGVL